MDPCVIQALNAFLDGGRLHVLILTEGRHEWGMGHLNRCLAFAKLLCDRGIVVRWLVVGDRCAEDFFHTLDCGEGLLVDWYDDSILYRHLEGCFCAIVDSYHAPLRSYQLVAAHVPHCIWIDDEARLPYPNGIIVNPNPLLRQKLIHSGNEGPCVLSDFSYQVLRPEFAGCTPHRNSVQIHRILIMMGGTDPRQLTPRIVPLVRSLQPDVMLDIVVPNERQREEWSYLADDNCVLRGPQRAAQIRELMQIADLAITAAGQTLCEAASVGLPVIAIGVAENQRLHVQALENTGAILLAGWYDEPGLEERLSAAMGVLKKPQLRQQMSEIGQSLVDGRGAERTLASALSWSTTLRLRRALLCDSRAVWGISNQSTVREFSINKDQIPWDSHQIWFAKTIIDAATLFLVAVAGDGSIAGQIRYKLDGDYASVSISLDSARRGSGEACRLLREGDIMCLAAWPMAQWIEAEISPMNPSSEKSFLRAGYRIQNLARCHEGFEYGVFRKQRQLV